MSVVWLVFCVKVVYCLPVYPYAKRAWYYCIYCFPVYPCAKEELFDPWGGSVPLRVYEMILLNKSSLSPPLVQHLLQRSLTKNPFAFDKTGSFQMNILNS